MRGNLQHGADTSYTHAHTRFNSAFNNSISFCNSRICFMRGSSFSVGLLVMRWASDAYCSVELFSSQYSSLMDTQAI